MNNLTQRGPARTKCTGGSASPLAAVLALLMALSAGCTFNHNLEIAPKLDTFSEPAKIPLTIGVYYSPEFSAYKHARVYGPHRYIVAVGKESAALFDKLALMDFQNVVHLDGLPPFSGKPANVDVIIEPDIAAFHFRVGFEGYTPEQGVGYRVNVFSREGVPLGSRTVFGQETPPQTHFYPWGHMGPDMQDAAGKVLQEFHRLPDAVKAAKAGEAAATAVDAAGLTARADAVGSPLRLTDELSLPLTETGILAVAVSIRNAGGRSVSVSDGNIRLVLPNGRTFASTGIATIPSRLEQRSYAFEAGGILGAHLAAVSAREKRAALLDALKKKALGERTLQKGESADGIVFFIPAEGTPSFSQADLSIWYLIAETRSGIRTSTPVAKLNFAPGPGGK